MSRQRKLRVLGTLDTERISSHSKSPESSMNLTCKSHLACIPLLSLVLVLPPQTTTAPANSSAIGHFLLFACGRLCMCTPWGMWRSEKMCESWFSPPSMPVPGIELQLPSLASPSPAAPSLQSDAHSLLSFLTSGLAYLSDRSKPMPSNGELTMESKDGIFTASLYSNSIDIEIQFIAPLATL